MSKDSGNKLPQPFFSLDDVDELLKKKKVDEPSRSPVSSTRVKKTISSPKLKPEGVAQEPKPKQQRLQAVSAAEILGFNPVDSEPAFRGIDESQISKKLLPFYRQLIELREHVLTGLDYHTKETLHRSSKDDSGDLSSYGQHLADAGTETFDRDFALSLVSSEKEALHEIEKAIERILDGTYGICRVTGKPISKERLKAVPFTRFSVEGQIEYERSRKKTIQRGGVFVETVEDTAAFTSDDDGDDS